KSYQTPEEIAMMNSRELAKAIKIASDQPTLPRPLIEAILIRMQRNDLSPKETLNLLCVCPPDSEEWALVRQRAWEYLDSRPHVAPSLLSMGREVLGWSPAKYEYGQRGAQFWCAAEASVEGGAVFASDRRYAGTKKDAEQRAALALM